MRVAGDCLQCAAGLGSCFLRPHSFCGWLVAWGETDGKGEENNDKKSDRKGERERERKERERERETLTAGQLSAERCRCLPVAWPRHGSSALLCPLTTEPLTTPVAAHHRDNSKLEWMNCPQNGQCLCSTHLSDS